jgi:hypothetical protein
MCGAHTVHPGSAIPLDKFTCVRELCFAAIRQFKPTALRSVQRGLGTGALLQPVEGRYQDELYRACGALLGEVYISSEWSKLNHTLPNTDNFGGELATGFCLLGHIEEIRNP